MSEGRSILKFKAHLDLATLTLYSPLYLLVVFGLFFIQGGFSLLVGYLLLLTIASFRAERSTEIQSTIPSLRFALLVPAYNEERLLPGLLNSLRRLDYPDDLYEIHVVADNCTDQTAL
ncbi:MAG: glycosyl transferase family 2, partial [Chloroflexi bacterium]|nr:glycosyl transferase family 2 [Chloroflexota bacterium]